MKDEIDVTPARINPVGQAVSESEELSGDTQAMKECPRFDGCNAPICPLDPDVLDRAHVKGDPVCHYLRLYVKRALWGLKAGSVPANLTIRIVAVYSRLTARYGPLKDALLRAAKSPPKGFSGGQDHE